MRASLSFAITLFLLGACSSSEIPDDPPCGPNGECPQGFVCEPKSRRCLLSSLNAIDGSVADAAATDGRAADAKPPADAAGSSDAARADAGTPDGALSDAPLQAAALTLTPESQDFGMAALGSDNAPLTFTVENTGDLASGPITATVSDDESYAVTGGTCLETALAGGADCTVLVAFNPAGDPGPKPATLTVVAEPGGAPTSSLTGVALTPGSVEITPKAVAFPAGLIGTKSADRSFTVKNVGQTETGTMRIALAAGGDFVIGANQCGDTLAAGASCTVGVAFKPRKVGLIQGAQLTVSAGAAGDAAAALSGTGNALVTVTNAGGGTVTSQPDGIDCDETCTVTLTEAPLVLTATPDGAHTFAGWMGACDGTGTCALPLTTATTAVTARFDARPDSHAVITAGPAALSAETMPSFTFVADGAVARLECRLEGAGAFATCTSPATYGPLADGDHIFEVRAVNTDGRPEAAPARADFAIDTAGPATSLTGPAEGSTSGRAVTFSFTAEAGASFACSLDSPVLAPCAGGTVSYPALAGGAHIFRVQASDTLGNPGALITRTWTVDATGPTTTITPFPEDKSDQTGTVVYSAEAGATFECSRDGGGYAACPATGYAFTGLGVGGHTIDVRATDTFHNTGEPSHYAWTVVGRVTVIAEDRDDAPIAGARVLSHRPDGSFLASATAGADGRATVEIVADGMVTVAWLDSTYFLHTIVKVQPGETVRVGHDKISTTLPTRGTILATLPQPTTTDPCCDAYYVLRASYGNDGRAPLDGFAGAGGDVRTVRPYLPEADSTGKINVLAVGVDNDAFAGRKFAWSTGVNLPLGGMVSTTLGAWQPAVPLTVNAINLPPDVEDIRIHAGVIRNGTAYRTYEYMENYIGLPPGPFGGNASGTFGMPPAGFSSAPWTRLTWMEGANVSNRNATQVITTTSTGTLDATMALPRLTSMTSDRTDTARIVYGWTAAGSLAGADGGLLQVTYGFVSGDLPDPTHSWFVTVPGGTTSVKLPQLPADMASHTPQPGNFITANVQFVESTGLADYAAYKANHWKYRYFGTGANDQGPPFVPAASFTTRVTEIFYGNL